MVLYASLITFSPNTTIRSQDMNTNFVNLNTISTLPIPFLTFTSDSNLIQSDGNGNVIWNGGIGKTNFNDIYDASSGTVILNEAASAGTIHLQIGGTDAVTFTVSGPTFPSGKKLTLTTGSISRMSHFSGSGTGTYSHGNGGVPDAFALGAYSTTTPIHFGRDTVTSTQVHITCDSANSFVGHVVAF